MNNNFENDSVKKSIEDIVDKVSAYNIFDFISRVSGLNLLSENQNKAVITDTLIQYILSCPKERFSSSIIMSDKKFSSLIEEMNHTFLSSSVDPCENTFIQNVMMNGQNFTVFNGIDVTPAYSLQALIRVLFGYGNTFDSEYLEKVNRLFAYILTVSDEVAKKIGINLENATYNEERRVLVPSGTLIKQNAGYIRLPVDRFRKYAGRFFDLNEMFVEFGCEERGDINNRPFYTKPFLYDESNDELIVLNISLLPAFAMYKTFEWAESYSIKNAVINKFNDYLWLDSKLTLDKLGHKQIKEEDCEIECISNDYFKEAIMTAYNNQVMVVFYLCDDGAQYSLGAVHSDYPDQRHARLLKKRLEYYNDNIENLKKYSDDIYVMYVVNSIGRNMMIGIDFNPFSYRPIMINPFELHCVKVHEQNSNSFFPRYIRAKSRIRTSETFLFSELNSICIYTSNNNSFYMNDDMDYDETFVYIAPGDSVAYITESLTREDRKLIDSYDDGYKTEVVLMDRVRNIYYESGLFSKPNIALAVITENIIIWIIADEFDELRQFNIINSLTNTISYWLAECKSIIDKLVFSYKVCSFHISIQKEKIDEYYCEKHIHSSFDKCISLEEKYNHIGLCFSPEAFCNLNNQDNTQEKALVKYLLDVLNGMAFDRADYLRDLDDKFKNPLKKKLFSTSYVENPYLKPLDIMEYRTVRDEDEDYLSGIIGKELLSTEKWTVGPVDDKRRLEIAKVVVEWLYTRLKKMVSELSPEYVVEVIYHDLEEILYRLILTEERYYSDILCYPERENEIIREYNKLNKTSLALKFLIEYVTACPPSGSKRLGIGQYEELLAICSMIVDWAYKGDLFFYNIVNAPVEFLKSKRIGMKHDEFDDMNQYNEEYRRRQLKFDSSSELRKDYKFKGIDYSEELDLAFQAEFGYTYTTFCLVIANIAAIFERDVNVVSVEEMINQLQVVIGNLSKDIISKILDDISYCERDDFLSPPEGFDKEDAFPWRFNRRYSFNRRPIMRRSDEYIWGNRQLFHMAEYIKDLIYSGKFKANSDEMKSLCGRIVKNRGAAFNDLIYQMISDMDEFILYPNVKKINGKRIADSGEDLGDVDILIIDEQNSKIIVTEVKNFRFSRNPREINLEYEKMFLDKADHRCFATKHKRRVEWVKNHISDVRIQYGLADKSWSVSGLFIVNQSLISQHIYKQDIKCISISELCVNAIRYA